MVLSRLRERNEWKFFAVLPKADRPSRSPGGPCSSCAACCPPCSPSRWACSSAPCKGEQPRRPAHVRRRRVRPAPGAHADPSGDQRQPRRPHGRVALRPADRGVRAAAGHGSPRGSEAHQRPHRRARFRPRHDRPAADHLDGLHRRRPGRDDRRPRVRRRAVRATRGGRRSCSAAPGSRRTGCCAKAPSGATATPRRCARAQRDADYAYRLAVDPRAGQGAAPVRPRRLDDRPLRRAPHAPARAAVRSDAAAREAGALEPAARRRRQRRSCSGRSPTRPPAAA